MYRKPLPIAGETRSKNFFTPTTYMTFIQPIGEPMNNSIKLTAFVAGFALTFPISTSTLEASPRPAVSAEPIAKVVALHDEAEFEYLPPVTVTVIEDEIEIEYIETN